MRRITAGAVVLALVAAGCGRSEARKRREIKNCSAISLDAAGISDCLVAEYRWSDAAARPAGVARQRELDSAAAFERDSLWRLDAPKHREELARCTAAGGDVTQCLEDAGWAEDRAVATFDSLWRRDAPRHREAVRACEQQRKSSVGSCLILYYRWDPKHALALDDSIQRAKVQALNRATR